MKSSLTIAGIEIGVSVPKGPLEGLIVERYAPFLGAIDDPTLWLQIDHNGELRGPDNPPLADVTGAGSTTIGVEHPDFSAQLDLEGDGTVTVTADPHAIDHFFRVLLGLLAPRHDAIMLHSCGLLSGAEAHVFVGPSGAGKSTLASLAGHRPLLSDEHVIVRHDGEEWTAASTPFWGSYAVPGPARTARVTHIWGLRQWPRNARAPMDHGHALRLLLDNAVLPCPDAGHQARRVRRRGRRRRRRARRPSCASPPTEASGRRSMSRCYRLISSSATRPACRGGCSPARSSSSTPRPAPSTGSTTPAPAVWERLDGTRDARRHRHRPGRRVRRHRRRPPWPSSPCWPTSCSRPGSSKSTLVLA